MKEWAFQERNGNISNSTNLPYLRLNCELDIRQPYNPYSIESIFQFTNPKNWSAEDKFYLGVCKQECWIEHNISIQIPTPVDSSESLCQVVWILSTTSASVPTDHPFSLERAPRRRHRGGHPHIDQVRECNHVL